MSALLWRVIIAVICCVLTFALMPPVFRLMGIGLDGDLLLVLRICVGGIALLYVVKGSPPWAA